MKEEEERKKIGKRRPGTMARPCHHRHGPCQLSRKVVGFWLGHRHGPCQASGYARLNFLHFFASYLKKDL